MTNEQAQKIIAQQNAQAELFRKHIRGFSAPSDYVVIEKVAEVHDKPVSVQIDQETKQVTPKATIVRIENNLVMLSGTGDKLSRAQVQKLLKPVQKRELTKVLKENYESRVEKLVPA